MNTLAKAVGLLRSVFAERFTRLVGYPAIQYIARWRLALAARQLREGEVSVAEAGIAAGYNSEAAFQRAFKKYLGVTPGAWRKRTAEPAPPVSLAAHV